MLDVSLLFHEVEDPRRSNATRHDLQEMLLIALLSVLSSGEGCVDMEHFGRAKEGFLRQFLRLERGIPSHDALTSSWTWLAPPCSLSKFQMRLPWGTLCTYGTSLSVLYELLNLLILSDKSRSHDRFW